MTYKQTHMIFEHLKYFRTVFVLRKKPIGCEIMNCNDQLLYDCDKQSQNMSSVHHVFSWIVTLHAGCESVLLAQYFKKKRIAKNDKKIDLL